MINCTNCKYCKIEKSIIFCLKKDIPIRPIRENKKEYNKTPKWCPLKTTLKYKLINFLKHLL